MELLIVIAVILTILGIAMPQINKILQETNEMAVLKQLGTIHTSQAQYHSQYDKYAVTLAELGPPQYRSPGVLLSLQLRKDERLR